MPRPRNVVLSEWESGVEPSEKDHLTRVFEVLGEITAHHRHSGGWKRPEKFERLIWDFGTSLGERPHWGRWRDGMGLDPAREALFARAVDLIGRRLAHSAKARATSA